MLGSRQRLGALAFGALLVAEGCTRGSAASAGPTASAGGSVSAPTGSPSGSPGAEPYAALVATVASEGPVNFQIQSSITIGDDEVSRRISEGVSSYYGVDIQVKVDSSLAYQAAIAKTITEVQANSPTSYDLLYQDTITSLPAVDAGVVETVDWTTLFPWLTDVDLRHDGLAPVPAVVFNLPAYNTQQVTGDAVPETWEDLLNPAFKGKMGATVYQEPWVPLALPEAWGEERLLEFIEKLSAQDPALGRFGELHQKLISGELSVFALDNLDWVEHDKAQGAPVDFVDLEPVLVVTKVLVVPQRSANSASAQLVAAWLLTPEGQGFMSEAYTTSPFREGTPSNEFLATRDWVSPDTEYLRNEATRVKEEVDKILVGR
jgi:ABC-type Fe3+ transport system substrate-binding protein